MAYIKFHRGTHQIGGCCTELCCENERILIDLGANLPGTDDESPISDDKLIKSVFDGQTEYAAILFTHYHGDHYGLYKDVPRDIPIYSDIPMYMGKTAKGILKIVTEYIDRYASVKGKELIEGLKTYSPGHSLSLPGISNMKIIPLAIDHSALDAYMFYMEIAGKKILYTGDFRDHGIASENDRFWNLIKSDKYIPSEIDILITEGTMLSRKEEANKNIVKTEAELGQEAAKRFREHPYNFVLVSSTNLDTIMELYHNTPDDLPFVCDIYQYRVICEAMRGKKDLLNSYRPAKSSTNKTKPIHLLFDLYSDKLNEIEEENDRSGLDLRWVRVASKNNYEELKNGFVMLVRPNHFPEKGKNPFEKALDYFSAQDESKVEIMYSMWNGYLEGDKEDKAITRMLASHHMRPLHVSGHAYPETILKLIETLNPKTIIPMHTEMADEMKEMESFSAYSDRIVVMGDETDIFDLDSMERR